jgi:hypothetical protein
MILYLAPGDNQSIALFFSPKEVIFKTGNICPLGTRAQLLPTRRLRFLSNHRKKAIEVAGVCGPRPSMAKTNQPLSWNTL